MESSLRTIIITNKDNNNTKDIFSIDKCFECILEGVKQGLHSL